jgi:hypothetical protein
MKRTGKELHLASSPKPKTFHMLASIGEVMLTLLFWYHHDPLAEHCMSKKDQSPVPHILTNLEII